MSRPKRCVGVGQAGLTSAFDLEPGPRQRDLPGSSTLLTLMVTVMVSVARDGSSGSSRSAAITLAV